MKTTVRITKQYENEEGVSESDVSVTDRDMQDAMYFALEKDWGVENWMHVMIANSICNCHFTEEGREALREFMRIEKPRSGIGIESIKQMYQMALEPDEH